MQFFQVASNNALFFVGLVLLVGLGLFILRTQSLQSGSQKVLGDSSSSFTSLKPQDFKQGITDDSVQLLDIRTASETAQGKIIGAVHLDYYAADFPEALAKLDRSKTYYIYCNSGNRTAATGAVMKQLGFSSVYDLQGGIQAWIAAGFETCTTC